MLKLCKAVAWAAAMIATAWAENSGLITQASAATLLAVMPALAVIGMRGGNCISRAERRA